MGLAMIFVVLFHVGVHRNSMMYGVVRCGNVGVDMFLFLSGIGLWFSWTGNSSLTRFFRKRYIRIYPAWLIMACLFYIPNYMDTPGGGYSPGLFHLAANIAVNWSFWRIDDLTFWFIPSIMMLYTFAPAYMEAIRREPSWRWLPVAFVLLAVMVHYYPPVYGAVGHVEIFFSRIPVFLLGINCGELVRTRRTAGGSSFWLVVVLFVMSLAQCVEFEEAWRGRFPLFLERMVYIPLSVTGMLLLVRLLRHTPQRFNRAMAFVGTVSLEIYLIHAQFVLKYVREWDLGFCLTAVITIAVSVLLAWLLHRAVGMLTGRMLRKERA